jgi:hypothetical protein
MRKTILICVLVILAWIGWLIWPLTALYALARAVEARNATAISEALDPLPIRRSLSAQVLEAYGRLTGAPVSGNSLIAAVTGSVADPLVAKIMSPEGITLLLQSGWVSPEFAERPTAAQGLSTRALGDLWQVFGNSRRELDRYWISFPADRPDDQRFDLEWRLRGLQWRIVAIRLPKPLLDRLAEQLIRIQRGLQQRPAGPN